MKEPKTYTVLEAVQYSFDRNLTPSMRRIFYRRHIPNATTDELAGAFRIVLERAKNAALRKPRK